MMEQILDRSCHSHHPHLLRLALRLVTDLEVSRLPAAFLVSHLLHSLSFPSQYPSSQDSRAELVRTFYRKSWSEESGLADILVTVADCDVITAVETVRLCRELSGEKERE